MPLKEGTISPAWKQATISVVPKEGKDHLYCSSFRPISVLNVDYKLFTVILSTRVQELLPELINTDQTGFVPQRQTHDHLRHTLHILSHIQKYQIPAAVVSVYTEKAFDTVSWDFLYKVLERFGFHSNFIKVIVALYIKTECMVKNEWTSIKYL